jgi:hypothetical protein
MDMHMRTNPPWADKAIKNNWEEIQDFQIENDLPVVSDDLPAKFKELGCGHYGCVLPTRDPETVFKLTSDPTEAEFIRLAEPLGWPDGIVRYHGMLPLKATFRRRPIFAIWREAASNVGNLYERYAGTDQPFYHEMKSLEKRLTQFKDHAARLRNTLQRAKDPGTLWTEAKSLKNWAWRNVSGDDVEGNVDYGGFRRRYPWFDSQRSAYRVAASFQACEIVAELMENAFSFYLEKGFLLADVHSGNVGQVYRHDDYEERTLWVITDPGHVVVLD